MYKFIIRPVFFLFNAEFIHNISLFLVKVLYSFPGVKGISKKLFVYKMKKNYPLNFIGKSLKIELD